MKGKIPAIALFIFILVVMFFLFPRGCPREAGSAISPSKHHPTVIHSGGH